MVRKVHFARGRHELLAIVVLGIPPVACAPLRPRSLLATNSTTATTTVTTITTSAATVNPKSLLLLLLLHLLLICVLRKTGAIPLSSPLLLHGTTTT